MLVLTRKLNEEIVIPGMGVTIKVLNVRTDRVAIGITAPLDVSIDRREKLERPSAPVVSFQSIGPAALP